MTDPKEKSKPIVPTRTPKKKTPGIFDNLRKIPQPHPVEEMLGLVSTGSTPSTGTTPSSIPTGSTPSTGSTRIETVVPEFNKGITPIAPQRDFTRVANSIVREAIPSGFFGGKSKQLYDYLYSLTRGAIVPKRTVRIPKDKLMKGAGIGSEVTLRTNLARLSSTGLIIERIFAGTHGGNEYEVFLPEEASQTGQTGATPSTPSSQGTGSSSSQFQQGVEALETTPSSTGLNQTKSVSSEESKTFFKTNTERDDDDAALAGLISTFKEAVRQVTGRELSPSERERWRELGEVLTTELKIAAARTTVSSVPAFLSEHLRRRLWKKDKQQLSDESRADGADSKVINQNMDISKCPDCGGSGMYYPQGYEKGVAKCRHEKLVAEGTGG